MIDIVEFQLVKLPVATKTRLLGSMAVIGILGLVLVFVHRLFDPFESVPPTYSPIESFLVVVVLSLFIFLYLASKSAKQTLHTFTPTSEQGQLLEYALHNAEALLENRPEMDQSSIENQDSSLTQVTI